MLTFYQTQTARLLHDPSNQAYSLADITIYINIARGQIALEGQCCRLLLCGGTITALSILSSGSGAVGSTPTITITGGSQAFATGTMTSGGGVNTVTLTRGGWGFITGTTPTVVAYTSGAVALNATFTTTVDHSLETVTGQEVYNFSTWNTLVALNSGFSEVLGVISVACSQSGTYKPMLTPMVFSEYQAYLRIYQNTQQNYPVYWSQFGYGTTGSIYLFPWPAQALQLDVDAYCSPTPLVDDTTAEAIPYPWKDAVPYYAAYLAYENSSRKEDADRMFKMYTMFMKRGRAFSEAPFMPSYYGGND